MVPRGPREPFNAWTHALGAVVMVGVATSLWTRSDTIPAVTIGVYLLGALAMFGASAFYHWFREPDDRLQKLDHSAIYLMIAGSYTALAYGGIGGDLGRNLLIAQWILASIGVASTFALEKPPHWLRLTLYLLMGWMIAPWIGPARGALGDDTVNLMVAGGLAYTVGAVVYASRRPNLWPDTVGSHGIWHLFVLAGAFLHAAAVWQIRLG